MQVDYDSYRFLLKTKRSAAIIDTHSCRVTSVRVLEGFIIFIWTTTVLKGSVQGH